ncbi:hypothetical protein [Oceanospirillum sanctuarii]|uniref:hypothetical protein n=1 Tax=Oceanospirillum sanctuarii TaxID=1434821 RepID=UPI000A3756AF|nr:hypothetical protein [Oceanospirillum sanctuarii]
MKTDKTMMINRMMARKRMMVRKNRLRTNPDQKLNLRQLVITQSLQAKEKGLPNTLQSSLSASPFYKPAVYKFPLLMFG